MHIAIRTLSLNYQFLDGKGSYADSQLRETEVILMFGKNNCSLFTVNYKLKIEIWCQY
jgi:hypothetical protein